MSVLLAVLLAGASVFQETSPAGGVGPCPYERQEFPLGFHERLEARMPEIAEMVGMFGRLVRVEAGETLELAAIRMGFDADVARAIHGLAPGRVFDEEELFFVDRYHRVVPGETREFLAQLYGIEVSDLIALEPRLRDAEPEAWTRVRVPVEILEVDPETRSKPALVAWIPPSRGLAEVFATLELSVRDVVEGDDFESLAEQFGGSVDRLRRVHRSPIAFAKMGEGRIVGEHTELEPGQRLLVSTTVSLSTAASPAVGALYVDFLSGGGLEEALVLNGVKRPEELATLERVHLPLHALQLLYGAVPPRQSADDTRPR